MQAGFPYERDRQPGRRRARCSPTRLPPPTMPRRPPKTSPASAPAQQDGEILETRAEFGRAKVGYARAARITQEGCSRAGRTGSRKLCQQPGLGAAGPGRSGGRQGSFERALRIDEASFGPDHPKVANDVNNLGDVLQDLGDLAGARAAFERALRIDEASFGPDHPNVAIRRQQPGRCTAGPGRSGGRQGGLRAGAPDRGMRASGMAPQRRHSGQRAGRGAAQAGRPGGRP